MGFIPIKYELIKLDEDAILINLHVVDNKGDNILDIKIQYDDFFKGELEDFFEYPSPDEAYEGFCDYLKERMNCFEDCPDVENFEKIRGYKTVYKKVCLVSKAIIADRWEISHHEYIKWYMQEIPEEEKILFTVKFADDPDEVTEKSNEPSPVLSEKGYFTNYSRWADIVHNKACAFYKKRGVYPNILLASDQTYEKINEYEQDKPENRVWEGDGEEPEEFEGFSTFVAQDYSLEFCVDNELKINSFLLVFDEDPTFDGEEIPEDSAREKYIKKVA